MGPMGLHRPPSPVGRAISLDTVLRGVRAPSGAGLRQARAAARGSHGLPNRHAVLNHLYALTGSAVPGATGRFGIDPTTGDRTPAPIVVHRLGATT